MTAVPDFLRPYMPPMVSFTYTKTISGTAVRGLDFNVGTEQMTCNCDSSRYTYAPAGHVVTGDLSIIADYILRKLITKGPSYREQNNINWNLNMKLCREAVMKYT